MRAHFVRAPYLFSATRKPSFAPPPMASKLRHFLRCNPTSPATKSLFLPPIRSKTTTSYGSPRLHEYSKPSDYLASWKDPSSICDPRDALKRLEMLRRDYERKVSACRKQYMYEMEMQKAEKLRKEEARWEAARVAKEERKAKKKEADEVKAARHKAFQEELRQTLMKERAKKLEYWRAKEASREKKKIEKHELLQKQSSIWIDEGDLEKKIRDSLIDVSIL